MRSSMSSTFFLSNGLLIQLKHLFLNALAVFSGKPIILTSLTILLAACTLSALSRFTRFKSSCLSSAKFLPCKFNFLISSSLANAAALPRSIITSLCVSSSIPKPDTSGVINKSAAAPSSLVVLRISIVKA